MKKIENIKREKYNPDNIFKNTKESICEEKHISSMIEVKEEKWYQKIFKSIKEYIYKLKNIWNFMINKVVKVFYVTVKWRGVNSGKRMN